MAYVLTDPTTVLTRTTGLVPASSDYTCIISIRPLSSATGAEYRTAFMLTNVDDSAYVGLFSTAPGNFFGLQLDNGGGVQSSATQVLITDLTQALVYIRKGTSHFLYRRSFSDAGGLSLIGTLTADVSAVTFTDLLVGNDGASLTNWHVSYFREWSRALTNNEAFMEVNGSLHAFDTDLETDTPLLTNLTDTSGNGNTFSVLGAAGTFTDNIPATSVDITGETFPLTYVVTPAVFNVNDEIWFKYTSTAGQVLGAAVTDPPANYETFFYASDGVSVVRDSALPRPFSSPIAEGNYYIQIYGGVPIAADFTVTFQQLALESTVPGCTAIINDDLSGYGAIAFAPTTGELIGYVNAIPSGELAAILPGGISLWHDRYLNYHDEYLVVLDPSFAVIASVDTTPSIGGGPLEAGQNPASFANTATDFYVLRVADNKVWTITSAGVITDTGATVVPHNGDVTSIGVNPEGTVLYWSEGDEAPYAVYAWDLVGNVELPTVYTTLIDAGYLGVTAINFNNGDTLTLDNGNILVFGKKTSDAFSTLYYIDPGSGGFLLGYFEFHAPYYLINHIAYAGGETIYVWVFDEGGIAGQLLLVDLNTEVITTIFTTSMFQAGLSLTDGTQSIGPSQSCTIVITQSETCDWSGITPTPPTPGVLGFATELPIRWVLRSGVIT